MDTLELREMKDKTQYIYLIKDLYQAYLKSFYDSIIIRLKVMGKELNRHLTKEQIWMANKDLKGYVLKNITH